MSEQKNLMYAIQPANIQVNGFKVATINITYGFNSADIRIDLYNDAQFITSKILTISGMDYTLWGDDVPYILNWICSQLGFTLV